MIEDEEEYTGDWIAASVECSICCHDWAASYPAVCEKLECPNCGYMTDAPSWDDDEKV